MRTFGGKLGEVLARAVVAGGRVFGLRIVDGDDRTTYMALEEAYEALLGKTFDWIVPLVIENGVAISLSPDGYPEGFAGQLARFCAANHAMLRPSLGIIQLASCAPEPYYPPHTGSGFPLTRYVAATPMFTARDGNIYPLAPVIASAIAAAPYHRGLAGLGMEIADEVLAAPRTSSDYVRMARRGLLLLERTVRRGWAIHKPVTQEHNGPSLSTMRFLSEILWRIRYGLSPYIGEPIDIPSVQDMIENILAEHPWVESFEVSVEREGLHGLTVRLSLQIRNEVSRIDVAGRID